MLSLLFPQGNFSKMEELLRCMQEDRIPLDHAVYGALLSCLGRQSESLNNTRNINGILTNMMREVRMGVWVMVLLLVRLVLVFC